MWGVKLLDISRTSVCQTWWWFGAVTFDFCRCGTDVNKWQTTKQMNEWEGGQMSCHMFKIM